MASEPNVRYEAAGGTAAVRGGARRKHTGAAGPSRAREATASPRHGKQDILRAATALFAEKGYHATSMQNIGDALGVQRGSLYHHIHSKEDLLYEIMRFCSATLLQRVKPVVAAPLRPDEKLTRFIEMHLDTVIALRPEFRVLVRELRSLPPARREKIVKYRDQYENLVRKIIADGVAAGRYRRVDPKYAGFVVLGVCNWFSQWYSPRGPLSRAQIARTFADLLLLGIGAAEGASGPRRSPAAPGAGSGRRSGAAANTMPEEAVICSSP